MNEGPPNLHTDCCYRCKDHDKCDAEIARLKAELEAKPFQSKDLVAENKRLKAELEATQKWGKGIEQEYGAEIDRLKARCARLEEALKELKDFNPHCCEDCPCDYFRSKAEQALSGGEKL